MNDIKPIDHENREEVVHITDDNITIIAGAGTGKTTILIDKILNILKSGFAEIDEIIAMTFTEKAALEMSLRLRYKLIKELENGNLSNEQYTRLKDTIKNLDSAHISTIHSFALSLIRERPIETNVSPEVKIMDDIVKEEILNDVFEDWFIEIQREHGDFIGEVLESEITIDDMKKTALRLVDARDLIPHLNLNYEKVNLEEEYENISSNIDRVYEFALKNCTDDEDRLFKLVKSYKEDFDKLKMAEDIQDTFKEYIFEGDRNAIQGQGRGRKGNWIDDGKDWVIENAELMNRVSKNGELKKSLLCEMTVRLLELLKEFIKKYDERKHKTGYINYSDMLLKARDLLRDNYRVRKSFQDKFKYILIDEFQDTDPLQVEIAFYLAEDSDNGFADRWDDVVLRDNALFIVGDPKQSIYHFRRADLATYNTVLEKLKDRSHYIELEQNFRSQRSIIEWVNALFSEVFETNEETINQPEYLPIYHFEGIQMEDRPGVIQLYPDEPDICGIENVDDAAEIEARYIASYIRWMVEEEQMMIYDKRTGRPREIQYRDVAVLFSARGRNEVYRRYFDDFNIPYYYKGEKDIFEGSILRGLRNLLRAIAYPGDSVSIAGALTSPLFGLTSEDLLAHKYNGGVINYLTDQNIESPVLNFAFDLMKRYYNLKDELKISEMIGRILSELSLREIIEVWGRDYRVDEGLISVLDIAQRFEKDHPGSIVDFVEWFDTIMEMDDDKLEIELVQRDEGANTIQCMTIHKAKGLEFPVVILSKLYGQINVNIYEVKDFLNESYELTIKGEFSTENFEEMKEIEKKMEYEEEVRLLYVAMTRARDYLILPIIYPESIITNDGQFFTNRYMKYLDDFIFKYNPGDGNSGDIIPYGGEFRGSLIYDISSLDLNPPEFEKTETVSKKFEKLDLDREKERRERLLSRFGGLKRDEELIGIKFRSVTDEKDEVNFRGGHKEGKLIGNIFHKVMEEIDFERGEGVSELVHRRCVKEDGEHLIDIIMEMLERTLASDIVEEAVRAERYYREVPVDFIEDDTLVSGKIDLLIEGEDGLIVVDYKTDDVDDDEWVKRLSIYARQVEEYARGVELATGNRVKEKIVFNPNRC